MNGVKKREANLTFSASSKEYSGSEKNTLKSRIYSMDKGWISKKREIKNLNRSAGKVKTHI